MEPQGPKRGWWADWKAQSQEESIGERLIEHKLARLEREARILRGVLALVVLALVVLAALHLARPAGSDGSVLRVRRIEVQSADGRPAVVLDADSLGGRIALRYSGKPGVPPPPAMFLGAAPEGGSIQLFEPGQNFYALGLELGREGQGLVKVRRRGMQTGLELRGPATDTAGGELLVFDAAGKPVVRIASEGPGRGVLTVAGTKP
jgi:hypothetical protein